jgi:hypothetical protein
MQQGTDGLLDHMFERHLFIRNLCCECFQDEKKHTSSTTAYSDIEEVAEDFASAAAPVAEEEAAPAAAEPLPSATPNPDTPDGIKPEVQHTPAPSKSKPTPMQQTKPKMEKCGFVSPRGTCAVAQAADRPHCERHSCSTPKCDVGRASNAPKGLCSSCNPSPKSKPKSKPKPCQIPPLVLGYWLSTRGQTQDNDLSKYRLFRVSRSSRGSTLDVVWLAAGFRDEHFEAVSIDTIQYDLAKNTLKFGWHSGNSRSEWRLTPHKPRLTAQLLDAKITHFPETTGEERLELDSYKGVSQTEAEKLICDITSFVAKARADTLQAKLDRLQVQHTRLREQHSQGGQQVLAPTPKPAISIQHFHVQVKNLAQKRYALLFGTNYANDPNPKNRLSKCVQDVYDLKEKLTATCGFEVTVFAECLATLKNMKECIQIYVKKLDEQVDQLDQLGDKNGPDAPVLMIMFAGHGCEIDGHPAILPHDFKEVGALSLSSILTELQKRKSRKRSPNLLKPTNLVILDCCRDDSPTRRVDLAKPVISDLSCTMVVHGSQSNVSCAEFNFPEKSVKALYFGGLLTTEIRLALSQPASIGQEAEAFFIDVRKKVLSAVGGDNRQVPLIKCLLKQPFNFCEEPVVERLKKALHAEDSGELALRLKDEFKTFGGDVDSIVFSDAWCDTEAQVALDAAAVQGSHTCWCKRKLVVKTQSKLRISRKRLKAFFGANGGSACANDSCDHPGKEIRSPSRYFTCSDTWCRHKFRCHFECLIHLHLGTGATPWTVVAPA